MRQNRTAEYLLNTASSGSSLCRPNRYDDEPLDFDGQGRPHATTAAPPASPHRVWQQPEHRLHERLPRVARRLRTAGVSTTRVEYDGHWGIAHIDLVTFYDIQNQRVEPALSAEMIEQIDDCFRDILETRYPKWANDEGAFGQFTWRLIDAALTHEHNTRYISFETKVHEGV